MKKQITNLYWLATLKRHNEGVDNGRWNIAKKIGGYANRYRAGEISADELVKELEKILEFEVSYRIEKGMWL